MVSIGTAPATAERWPEVVSVFGRRGDDPGWCWCRRFLDPPPDAIDPSDNREALRHEIRTAVVAPGVIAYLDRAPAGWTRVMPRSALPAVLAKRALRRVLTDDPGAWWVTCFAIDRRARAEASRPPAWMPWHRPRSRRNRRRGTSSRHGHAEGSKGERLCAVHRHHAHVRS